MWNRTCGAGLLALLPSLWTGAALAADVCPKRAGQPVRFVDVFDGPTERLEMLVPDRNGKTAGYWKLGYIYDGGRFVMVRCKYADGQASDVKLSDKVAQCDYRIDAKKTLSLSCK